MKWLFCSRNEPNSPLLKFRWGNQSCCAVLCVFQLALPPVMVIFVDNLDYVTHPEANPCLFTGDEVILHRIILELCPHIDLRKDNQSKSEKPYSGTDTAQERTDWQRKSGYKRRLRCNWRSRYKWWSGFVWDDGHAWLKLHSMKTEHVGKQSELWVLARHLVQLSTEQQSEGRVVCDSWIKNKWHWIDWKGLLPTNIAKIELNVIFSKNHTDDVIVFESLLHLDLNGYTTVFQSSGLGSFFKILPWWKMYPWLKVWRSRAWEYYKHHAISRHCGDINTALLLGLVRWRMQL